MHRRPGTTVAEQGTVTGGLVKRVSPAMVHAYFEYMTSEYGDAEPAAVVAVAPLAGQCGAPRAAVPVVSGIVPGAQPQRGERHLRADADATAAVASGRLLAGQPLGEVGAVAVPVPVVIPAELVIVTQPQRHVAGRAVRADPAWLLLYPLARTEGLGRLQEAGPRPARVPVLAPEHLVGAAQVAVPHHGPLASCQAVPPVDGMPGGDLDDVPAAGGSTSRACRVAEHRRLRQ
jgi:hypothetical protein